MKPVRTERLLLSTFGNETEQIKTLNVFELSVKNPETGFVQVIQPYEVPIICDDLVGQGPTIREEKVCLFTRNQVF